MKETFINSSEDMAWLRDVHLPGLSSSYKSAVIFGNEDYPDQIEVYEKRDPEYGDTPVTYQPDDTKSNLVYRRINPMSSRRRYYRNPPRSKSSGMSGMSDGAKVALAVGGVAVLAGIGYLVYKSTSSSSSSSSTLTSGAQTTTLGPGGSNVPLPGAGAGTDTTPTQYEAGAGPDAPLVPTATG